MTKIFIIIICFLSISSFSQDLTCADFEEGNFNGTSPQLPGIEWKVSRTQNNQVETLTKVPQIYIDNGIPMDPVHGKFELIDEDECTFKFVYDETKMELDSFQRSTNENGGIIVKINSIEGKCFYYTSTSIIDNKEMKIEGNLCKE